MTLKERREALFPHYERPAYYGVMKPWRVELIQEWLREREPEGHKTYLDVGCGPAETREMTGLWWRGCDVVESVCGALDVDLIPGAHDLGIYNDKEFHIATCNDVLEHMLEEDIPAALSELSRVTTHAILLGISQKPGTWHLCIQTTQWWVEAIAANIKGDATLIYEDRIPPVKQPYLWVDVKCS